MNQSEVIAYPEGCFITYVKYKDSTQNSAKIRKNFPALIAIQTEIKYF